MLLEAVADLLRANLRKAVSGMPSAVAQLSSSRRSSRNYEVAAEGLRVGIEGLTQLMGLVELVRRAAEHEADIAIVGDLSGYGIVSDFEAGHILREPARNRLEHLLKRKPGAGSTPGGREDESAKKKGGNKEGNPGRRRKRGSFCGRCGKPGHFRRDCPVKSQNPPKK